MHWQAKESIRQGEHRPASSPRWTERGKTRSQNDAPAPRVSIRAGYLIGMVAALLASFLPARRTAVVVLALLLDADELVQ
ncbi:hypothetical protein GCM10023194_27830 [Planotetraspora phitsanulokensis]|uniref:Uncharacterized protein n=1 Tax=Planotetraspora phitsanulokensis TaxID=575192 RepID=A0A8J3XCJ7_9ACTN|nr:hypothetical protein Pph01_10830 [Planotetraspora phitsanulokensis]